MTRFPIDGTGRLASEREHPTAVLPASVVTVSRFIGADNTWCPLNNYANCLAADSTYLYFGYTGIDRIGRVQLDGKTGFNDNFIDVVGTLGDDVQLGDIAVDAAHIYWNDDAGHLTRATIGGTAPVHLFTVAGRALTGGLAVDANFIYYGHVDSGTFEDGRIGRCNLDGTGRNDNFMALGATSTIVSLAVNAAHIYWADSTFGIGRANLAGTGAVAGFISGQVGGAAGMAIDSQYVYWASAPSAQTTWGGQLARHNLDGTGITTLLTPASMMVQKMVVTGSFIYWTSEDNVSIGRGDPAAGNQRYTVPDQTSVNDTQVIGLNVAVAGRGRTLPNLKATTLPNTGVTSGGNIPIPLDAPTTGGATYGFTQRQAQAILTFLNAITLDMMNMHAVLAQILEDLQS